MAKDKQNKKKSKLQEYNNAVIPPCCCIPFSAANEECLEYLGGNKEG